MAVQLSLRLIYLHTCDENGLEFAKTVLQKCLCMRKLQTNYRCCIEIRQEKAGLEDECENGM